MANNKKPGGRHAVKQAQHYREQTKKRRKDKKIAHAREMQFQADKAAEKLAKLEEGDES